MGKARPQILSSPSFCHFCLWESSLWGDKHLLSSGCVKNLPGGLGRAGLGFHGFRAIFQPKRFCDSSLNLLGTKSFPWLRGQLGEFPDEVRVGPAAQEFPEHQTNPIFGQLLQVSSAQGFCIYCWPLTAVGMGPRDPHFPG